MEKVIVLMSTFNGEKYLVEQIDSLLHQRNVEVRLIVRDDGSTDETINILRSYEEKGLLSYYTGPNLRPAKSFMDLIMNSPEGQFYALCDQDDSWDLNKLQNAVKSIKKISGPVLYYCGMNLVDSNLQRIGYYFRDTRYSTSMVHSCLFGDEIAGCTMVFNRDLMEAIRQYIPKYITMHDGWIHRVCLCEHGTIIGDPNPYILYRQHGNNAVGMKKRSVVNEITSSKQNRNKFSSLAIEMLQGYRSVLKPSDIMFLQELGEIRTSRITRRISFLFRYIPNNVPLKHRCKLCWKVLSGTI